MESHLIHKTYRASLLELAGCLVSYPFLRKEENELRAVADSLQSPFNIAVFGRMKTGKSSLINALIGKPLAITGVEEATATINRISYASGELLNQFTVHWQDSPPENYPIDKLQSDWNGKSQEVLERVSRAAWLELYSDAPTLRNIQITDTPGTGSNAAEHERIANQFINGQEADALLYVFAPVGRENDEESLAAFRQGCLPSSKPDNSIGVLHKWDHIFWDEDDWTSIVSKAKRVHNHLSSLVFDIVPVSAPLALLAKTAPEGFWKLCREVLSAFDDVKELTEVLGDDEEWEDDPKRDSLYKQAKLLGCPLPSFRIMLRHLFRNPNKDEATAVAELSGVATLETLLDKQIFRNSSVIQQKQNSARARRVMKRVNEAIIKELDRCQLDIDMMEKVYDLLQGKDVYVQRWMDAKRAEMILHRNQLEKEHAALDRVRIKIADWADSIMDSYDLLLWLRESSHLGLPSEAIQCFSSILDSLIPGGNKQQTVTMQDVFKYLPLLNKLLALPCTEDKRNADRLQKCVMQWCAQQQS